MKKLLLAFAVSFLALGFTYGQVSIEIHPEDMTYNMQTDLTDEYSEIIAHGIIINTSDQAIKVRWELEVPTTDCVSQWQYLVCDKNACYSTNVVSNINPGSQPNKSVDLAPGDTSLIDMHIRPTLVAGCCSPMLRFTEITNLNSPIDLGIATYEVCISALSSVKDEIEGLNIAAFPNPTTGAFTLTDNPFVKGIAVFDMLGQKVCHYPHSNGAIHDLGKEPNGMYFINLLGEDGEMLKTIRMMKEADR